MVSPTDTLVVMIEAAAALAGFAGIVATLRRERWTQLDRLQIMNLLSCSFSALFVSILALVLMHAEVEPQLTWQILSAIWFVMGLLATVQNARSYRRMWADTDDADDTGISAANLVWFSSALAVLVLQVYNVVVVMAFWPVLVGIAWLFALSCYSFWHLLIRDR